MKTSKDFKLYVLSHELIEYKRGVFRALLYETILRFRSYVNEQNVDRRVYELLANKFGYERAKIMMSESVNVLLHFMNNYIGRIDNFQKEYDNYVKEYMPFLIEK